MGHGSWTAVTGAPAGAAAGEKGRRRRGDTASVPERSQAMAPAAEHGLSPEQVGRPHSVCLS